MTEEQWAACEWSSCDEFGHVFKEVDGTSRDICRNCDAREQDNPPFAMLKAAASIQRFGYRCENEDCNGPVPSADVMFCDTCCERWYVDKTFDSMFGTDFRRAS